MGCVKSKKSRAEEMNFPAQPEVEIEISVIPLGDSPAFAMKCNTSTTTKEISAKIREYYCSLFSYHLLYEGSVISELGEVRNTRLRDIGITRDVTVQLLRREVSEPESQCRCVRDSENGTLPIIEKCSLQFGRSSFICTSIALVDSFLGIGMTQGKFKIFNADSNKMLHENLEHKGIVDVVADPNKVIFYTISEFDIFFQIHTPSAQGFTVRVVESPYRSATLLVPISSDIIVFGDYYDTHRDTSIRVHRTSDGHLLERVVVGNMDGMISCLSISRDNKIIFVCCMCSSGGKPFVDIVAYRYEEENDIKMKKLYTLKNAHTHACNSLLDIAENRLISAASDGTVRYWDTSNQTCLNVLTDGIEKKEKFLSFSAAFQNPFLYFSGRGSSVGLTTDIHQYVFENDSFELKQIIRGHRHNIRSLVTIKDDLITCCDDGIIRFWE